MYITCVYCSNWTRFIRKKRDVCLFITLAETMELNALIWNTPLWWTTNKKKQLVQAPQNAAFSVTSEVEKASKRRHKTSQLIPLCSSFVFWGFWVRCFAQKTVCSGSWFSVVLPENFWLVSWSVWWPFPPYFPFHQATIFISFYAV
jgi:hypothetical protein